MRNIATVICKLPPKRVASPLEIPPFVAASTGHKMAKAIRAVAILITKQVQAVLFALIEPPIAAINVTITVPIVAPKTT